MSSQEHALPTTGRIAGIDYGTVRIGIAITDPTQSIASPFENYTRRDPQRDDGYFVELVKQERVVGFVVGLPVHMSGDESQKSREARKFGDRLGQVTSRPVCYFDERFTTAMASELLQDAGLTKKGRKSRLDKIAAQILLAAFLESSRESPSNFSLE